MDIPAIPQELVVYGSIVLAFALVMIGDIIKNREIRMYTKLAGFAILLIVPILSLLLYSFMDFISSIFSILAAIVGMAVTVYVDSYEVLKYRGRNLRMLIDVFSLSIYAVFASPNLISFIMFWLFAEIVGFFAIVFEIHRRTLVAGLRYLLVSMVPADIALIALIALASMSLGFENAMILPMTRIHIVLGVLSPALSILILLGFMAKAAVAPLHFWLPDAHSLAPAPASALLSGVMVKMGIYGMIRILPSVDPIYTPYVIMGFAALTTVYGGLQALVQSDIKRLLAYSTIENTSLMVLALAAYKVFGIGALWAATLTMAMAHGIFKAALFMDSGVVEISTHTRELPKLGFLSRFLPLSSVSSLVSVLSLLGVPPTLGFLGKLYLFAGFVEAIYVTPTIGIALLVVAALGAALAVAYGVRYLTVYWGSIEANPSEMHLPNDKSIILSEFAVAILSIILAVPFYLILAIAGYATLELVYIAPFALLEVAFLVLLYHVYTHTRTVAQDIHWLGGAVP
ncbi:MAG TPA: hypothetical protein ENF93_00985 [Ignisphaera sp.]|nr:hypothetical protein [Ignisphaera sp.]